MKIYFLPGGGTESSPSVQMWTECRDSLLRVGCGKGKIVTSVWKKQADTTIIEWSVIFFLKIHTQILMMSKTLDNPNVLQSIKYLHSILQNCQGHKKKQGKAEKQS